MFRGSQGTAEHLLLVRGVHYFFHIPTDAISLHLVGKAYKQLLMLVSHGACRGGGRDAFVEGARPKAEEQILVSQLLVPHINSLSEP